MKRSFRKTRVYLIKARAQLRLRSRQVAALFNNFETNYSAIETGKKGRMMRFLTMCQVFKALEIPLNVGCEKEMKYLKRRFVIREEDTYQNLCYYQKRPRRIKSNIDNYRFYLYKARCILGYSITEFARKSGVNRTHYLRVENGNIKDTVSFVVMYRIAKTLELDFNYVYKCELDYLYPKYPERMKKFNSK